MRRRDVAETGKILIFRRVKFVKEKGSILGMRGTEIARGEKEKRTTEVERRNLQKGRTRLFRGFASLSIDLSSVQTS